MAPQIMSIHQCKPMAGLPLWVFLDLLHCVNGNGFSEEKDHAERTTSFHFKANVTSKSLESMS